LDCTPKAYIGGSIGIEDDRHSRYRRRNFHYCFKPFAGNRWFEIGESGRADPWMYEALNRTTSHGISDLHEHGRHPLFDKIWKLPDVEALTPANTAQARPAPPSRISSGIPVTVDNFVRAETDRAFAGEIQLNDSFGKFNHRREMLPLNQQVVPRVNRDTLYSTAVFDLDAGPVTITMPGALQSVNAAAKA
jgi:hypothetical protein